MSENDEKRSDLSYDPVEGFLRNEALSRFSVEWQMPFHLFDWEPPSKRLVDASNLSEEEFEERHRRDIVADWETNSSAEEDDVTYVQLQEKMVTEVWEQLSRFYERQGYNALHSLQESLETRMDAEETKIEVHRQRHEYLSRLRAVLNGVSHGENEEVKTLLENAPEAKATWSEAERGGEVRVRLNESELSGRDVNVENLKFYPWHAKKNATLGEVIKEVSGQIRKKKRQIVDWGDTLKLMYLRHKLLARKIWLIDMGVSHQVPPELYVVPDEIRRKGKSIKYCLMILSVMDEIEGNWPSQPELCDILVENYNFNSIGREPDSVVSRAASFIQSERSVSYRNFRPDFYHRLKIDAGYLRYVAKELEIDLPE